MSCCVERSIDPGIQHRDVMVRGQRLHLLERGTGPLVLLLHGFPARASCFRPQLHALSAAGFKVVAPNLLGVPPSSQPTEVSRYETRELVADLSELIEQLGYQRAHVVGHDWGAGLGWELAQSFPGRVDSLVSLCVPSPRRMLAALLGPRQLMRSWYIFFFQLPLVPELWLARVGLDYFFREYPAVERKALLREIEDNGGVGRFVDYYRANLRAALRGKLEKRKVVPVPVLTISAGLDRFVHAGLFELEPTWVPLGELVAEPLSDHWLPMLRPELVNPSIISFIKGVAERKGPQTP